VPPGAARTPLTTPLVAQLLAINKLTL